MNLCNLPLIIPLTSWMRWKEFSYYVYLQIQRFILPSYRYDIATDKKKGSKNSFYKFHKYLNSSTCPYTLHLTTFDGRCIKCFKFIKSIVLKAEY